MNESKKSSRRKEKRLREAAYRVLCFSSYGRTEHLKLLTLMHAPGSLNRPRCCGYFGYYASSGPRCTPISHYAKNLRVDEATLEAEVKKWQIILALSQQL